MALDSHILTITEPTIKLEEVQALDMGQNEGGDNWDTGQGGYVPLIKINGYVFQEDEVEFMSLNLTGKYPSLNATLIDKNGVFTVAKFPRDGDILSLRIAIDKNGTYKDIRMDFTILDFKGDVATSAERAHGENTLTVSGIAKIPGIYAEECKAYGKGTSYDHIIKIAEDLQLGVATNLSSTSDEMPRICAYQTKLSLLDEIVSTSYASDESFQTYSIDPYYYINFVDLQKVFNAPEEVEMDEMTLSTIFKERATDPEDGEGKIESELILTNHHNSGGTKTHFESYGLVNASTRIALENGYRRTMQYFDLNEEGGKLLEFNVESLVSSNIKDDEEPLKGGTGTKNDEYSTQTKHKFIGLQDSADNVHTNFAYGFIHNYQNLVELEKMKLVVTLDAANPAIYRYMKIPVAVYLYSDSSEAAVEAENKLKKENGFQSKEEEMKSGRDLPASEEGVYDKTMVLDEFTSGYYVVMGIEYIFRDMEMKQKLHLARREWPVRQSVINKMTT